MLILALVLAWTVFWGVNALFKGRVWWWELWSMVPAWVMLVIFVVLVLACLASGNWIGIGILIATLPWVWPRIGLHFPIFPPPQSGLPLRLFSWNTEWWDQGDVADHQQFVDLITSQGADVYHLQEVMDHETNTVAFAPYAEKYFAGWNYVQHHELVTVTRFPIVGTYLGKTYLPWANFVRVDIQAHGQIISLYNVHIPVPFVPSQLISPSKFFREIPELSRARQQALQELISDISTHNHPVIISGDFNTASLSTALHDLESRFVEAGSVGVGFNYSWQIGPLRMWKLDWVFSSKRLIVPKAYKIVSPRHYSDHQGLKVDFLVKNSAKS